MSARWGLGADGRPSGWRAEAFESCVSPDTLVLALPSAHLAETTPRFLARQCIKEPGIHPDPRPSVPAGPPAHHVLRPTCCRHPDLPRAFVSSPVAASPPALRSPLSPGVCPATLWSPGRCFRLQPLQLFQFCGGPWLPWLSLAAHSQLLPETPLFLAASDKKPA